MNIATLIPSGGLQEGGNVNVVYRAGSVGSRAQTTAVAAGSTPNEAFSTTTVTAGRQGVNIKNHSTSTSLRVYLTSSSVTSVNSSVITSTNYDFRIPPSDSRYFAFGEGISLWLTSDDSGTVSYSAVEIL